MDRELKNREQRLRYQAKKKGLQIKKENFWINNEKYSGYLVIKHTGTPIVSFSRPLNNLMTIDEAEAITSEY